MKTVEPKPPHLSARYGRLFSLPSVAEHYEQRPPMPSAVRTLLLEQVPRPGRILDAGAGTGRVARLMVGHVEQIDAIEPSPHMIRAGRRLPGGADPSIRWQEGTCEALLPAGPYDLIVCACSLHWMDWVTVLPAMADSLTSDGWMAVVQERVIAPPWRDAMVALIGSYSVNTDFRPYNVVEEVVSRELFAVASVHETPLQTLEQPSERYVDALHARNGLMVEELGEQGTAEFDARLLEVLECYGARPNVKVRYTNRVTFGRPLRPV